MMTETTTAEVKNVIKTGNEELDRRIGGIPVPSLMLIEGPSGSGKSVFVQQVCYGALSMGLRTHYFTTENTITSFLEQMESLNFTVMNPHYLSGALTVHSINAKAVEWTRELAHTSLDFMLMLTKELVERLKREVIIVDNISHFLVMADEFKILDFFTNLKDFVDEKKISVILTVHPHVLNKDLLVRVRSVCDGNIHFSIKDMGEQVIRVLKVMKMRGASKKIDSLIGFVVDPAFGLKILPISLAKA
ncbi:ATPase domain-containing protein [Thermoflexus hugenholtzii]